MDDIIQKRLDDITKEKNASSIWNEMETFAYDMHGLISLSKYADDVSITISPNDMRNGSISFHTSALPKDVVIKMWYVDGYYAAFFKRVDAYFDHIITHTINESGVIPIVDIDEAEDRILDFIANDIYKKANTKTLRAGDSIE